jgi:ureidoglycolate dehydrogenase (NAD+)
MNGVALALKVGGFVDPDVFRDEVSGLADAIHGLPKGPGTEAILMPGERGFNAAKQHAAAGIPISNGTIKRIAALGERLGVASLKPIGS